jgi:hypothetical protein
VTNVIRTESPSASRLAFAGDWGDLLDEVANARGIEIVVEHFGGAGPRGACVKSVRHACSMAPISASRGGGIRSGWKIFRAKVPLTDAEFQRIANNRARFPC